MYRPHDITAKFSPSRRLLPWLPRYYLFPHYHVILYLPRFATGWCVCVERCLSPWVDDVRRHAAWFVYQNGGFYSCLECITMVVSGVRGAASTDGRSVSDSPRCVCQSHWLHPRSPHVMAPGSR